MEINVKLPVHISSHIEFLVQQRQKARLDPGYVDYTLPDGTPQRQHLTPLPPLSRTAVLNMIIDLGFERFLVEYPTEGSVGSLRGWAGAKK